MRPVFIHQKFASIYERWPITLIDIGASGGIPRRWARAEKYLKVIGFEPDERAFRKLSSTDKIKYLNTALSDSPRQVQLYLTRKQECSSLFFPNYTFLAQFPNRERFDIIDSVILPAKKLDIQLLQSVGINDPDFLKIDVQGGELSILQGADDILGKYIFGIEVEVEFIPIYENQPLFGDVDNLLREKGFHLFDLRRYFWKRNLGRDMGITKGQIICADALYFKSYESLVREKETNEKDNIPKKAKILKAISQCLIYGISDYALYLNDRGFSDHIFTQFEHELIYKSIYKKRVGINFRGQDRLANMLYKLYYYLRSSKWYYADEELGNN